MDKYQLIRESAEDSLEVFIKLVAPHLVLGGIHQEIIQWWNREDKKDNQLLLLPRGHLKSKLVAYRAAWWITKHPETTILYVSATAALAEKQLYQIKQIIDSPIYKRYWPEMLDPEEGKREKWAVAEICVDHPKRKKEGIRDSTVWAAGLRANYTGFHADVVILDDVVVPTNAYTEEGRETVGAAYSQLASIENPGALEWVVGTRYHPKDIYQTMIEMKAETFDDDGEIVAEEEIYELFQQVVETNGEFIWPRQMRADGKYFGFDKNILARIKGKYVDYTQFFSQYYNNPNSAESARIGSDKFQYFDRNLLTNKEGDWFIKDRKLNVFAAIDFAFSIRKKADYSALVIIGVDHLGNFYVLDIDRFKTDRILEYFNHIVKAQQKWGFRKIRAEVTVAQQTVVNELKESYIKPAGLPLSVDEVRPSRHEGDKEERINAILEPKYDNMQMWHYRGGNCQSLEEELVMARPPHDDIKDALANAVAIATIPKQRTYQGMQQNVLTHPRFGGVAY
jgi:phage terminase large subunit-like protein